MVITKLSCRNMEQKDNEAIRAAENYIKEKGGNEEVYNAFLAGVQFQKTRFKKPKKEYYGG